MNDDSYITSSRTPSASCCGARVSQFRVTHCCSAAGSRPAHARRAISAEGVSWWFSNSKFVLVLGNVSSVVVEKWAL